MCSACTYLNLQAEANSCFVCHTIRRGIGPSSRTSGVPLVDLTCLSPKHEGEEKKSHDIMESNRRKRMKRRREDECKRGPKLASTSKPRKDIGGMVDIDIFDPERKQRPSKKISTESSGCPNLNISHPSHHSPEEMYNKALALLRQTFQHQSLRNLQDRAVRGALQKKSQIIVLATGG